MSEPGRIHDVSTLTAAELERAKRELQASLSLVRPGSAVSVPIKAHLSAVDTELTRRSAERDRSELKAGRPPQAAPEGTRRFEDTYSAEPMQVSRARRALAQALDGCPGADTATLIASEFATNAVLHSASAYGGKFTLRAEISPAGLRVEVEDAGGRWKQTPPGDGRPHGFDLIEALTGHENWGIKGDAAGRVAWATVKML